MVNLVFALDPRSLVCLVVAATTLGASACSGADHLTEPLVSVGGNYLDSIGITPSSTSAGGSANAVGGAASASGGATNASGGANANQTGGAANANQTGGAANANQTGGNTGTTTSTAFEWGSSSYDSNGGANVTYQAHYAGRPCMVTCHVHTMTLGGTAYQPDGTTAAANAQLGLLVNGNLTTTYSGSAGNFFVTVSGSIDWATAKIAIRTATGTSTMPVNASASGNCNSCHDSSNRIVIP